jgi:hypothetical protein
MISSPFVLLLKSNFQPNFQPLENFMVTIHPMKCQSNLRLIVSLTGALHLNRFSREGGHWTG